MTYEKYIKDNKLKEEYRYDVMGHKIKQVDYKNGDPIKSTAYSYNSDGLVDVENISNLINNQRIGNYYLARAEINSFKKIIIL